MLTSPAMLLTRSEILLVLAQGAVVMIAAVLMVAALVRSASTTLWQTAAIATPILAGAIGAYLAGGVSSALTLLIAASVSAMLFCNGAAMLIARPKEGDAPAAGALATLIFPIGVVLLLSGFAAHATTASLVGLVIVGILAMDISRGEPALPSVQNARRNSAATRALALFVSLLAAAVLAFASLSLLRGLEHGFPLVRSDAFLILFVAPAVTLPMLVHCTRCAAAANLAAGTRLTGAITCLLLGIVLPIFVIVDYAFAARLSELAQPAGLPAISWRLDSPLLIMAGFGMLGMRLGFLRPDRWIALLFVLIYAVYVLTGTILRIG